VATEAKVEAILLRDRSLNEAPSCAPLPKQILTLDAADVPPPPAATAPRAGAAGVDLRRRRQWHSWWQQKVAAECRQNGEARLRTDGRATPTRAHRHAASRMHTRHQ
jgi:hypothetical protein